MNEETAKIINIIQKNKETTNMELIKRFGGSSSRYSMLRKRYNLPGDPTNKKQAKNKCFKKPIKDNISNTNILSINQDCPKISNNSGCLDGYQNLIGNDSYSLLRYIAEIVSLNKTGRTKQEYIEIIYSWIKKIKNNN